MRTLTSLSTPPVDGRQGVLIPPVGERQGVQVPPVGERQDAAGEALSLNRLIFPSLLLNGSFPVEQRGKWKLPGGSDNLEAGKGHDKQKIQRFGIS